jgi:hypothetical protein
MTSQSMFMSGFCVHAAEMFRNVMFVLAGALFVVIPTFLDSTDEVMLLVMGKMKATLSFQWRQ